MHLPEIVWSVVSCILLNAQFYHAQDIVSVRLRDQRFENTEVSGVLELQKNDGQWLPATRSDNGESVAHHVANVVCRTLQYGFYQRSIPDGNSYEGYQYYDGYQYYNRHYSYSVITPSVSIGTIECNGKESTIKKCAYTPSSIHGFMPSRREIRIYCTRPKCRENNGGCDHTCNDNPIESTEICSCLPGYKLHRRNRTICTDINECLVNNAGCTHGCFNTIGSYQCTCPSYMSWNATARCCTEQGFYVHCEAEKMQIAFTKVGYPMLSIGGVSLLDNNCLPEDNGTHIVFTTLYESCMTTRAEDTRGITYSNSVVDTENSEEVNAIKFASEIKFEFSCVINKKSTSSASLKTQPVTYTTNPTGFGTVEFTTRICHDVTCNGDVVSTPVKESSTVYAQLELHTQDYDMSFRVKNCFAYPEEQHGSSSSNPSKSLIVNGAAAADWVTIAERNDSTKYELQFPAFNFVVSEGPLVLECHLELFTSESSVMSATSTNSTNFDKPKRTQVTSPTPSGSVPPSTTATKKLTADVNEKAKTKLKRFISSCNDINSDGEYAMVIGNQIINVWCDATSSDGPWMVIMRRNNGRLNFNKTWLEYEAGFGNSDGEFWFGNSLLYNITRNQEVSLRITLTSFSNATAFAEYSDVQVGPATTGYALKLGDYNGTAGDIRNVSGCFENTSFIEPIRFSTYDNDNDGLPDRNCAARGGGWWYYDCSCTCLTCGPSVSKQIRSKLGMIYHQFNQFNVLKVAEMKIKVGLRNKAYPNTVAVGGSSVSCRSLGMTVSLDKEVHVGPASSFGSFSIQSDSFVSQNTNESHAMFNFTLRAMDTIRRENLTTISYTKRVAVMPRSNLTYYSRIVISSECHFLKAVVVKSSYLVKSDSAKFIATERGTYQVKLVMYQDDKYKDIVEDASAVPEGQSLYVKAVPVQQQADLKLAITSCYLGRNGEGFSMDYQLVQDRCPVANDVQIVSQDIFSMRIASYMRHTRGTRVHCDIQVCTVEDESCGDACDRSARRKRSTKKLHASSRNTASSVVLS